MGTEKRERHKAKRQARLEAERKAAARAQRKRRLVTAVVVTVAVVASLFLISFLGGDDDEGGDDRAATSTSTTASTVAVGDKPVVEIPEGEPPTDLVSTDLVEGTGDTLDEGETALVHYVGVSHATGEEFDSNWDGDAFEVEVGAGGVIPGWDQGLPGMKVGGRRQLVIPPDLAYGADGQGPIGPDETLVFVIELVGIT